MGIYNSLKSWFANLGNKRLTEGSEQIIEDNAKDEQNNAKESNINNIQEAVQERKIVKEEYKKIKFNIRDALRDCYLWYSKPFHSSKETYEGQIAILQSENDEIIVLNYIEGRKNEQMILGTAHIPHLPDGDVKQRRKELSFRIDRLLCDMYREDELSEKTLGNSIYNIQENYGVEFTPEGLAVLNNPTRRTIIVDKTAILLKDQEGKIIGCEKKIVPKKEEKSTFSIFDKENQNKGNVNIVCNKYNLSQFKDEASKRNAIIEHAKNLSELFGTCNELGIFTGQDNKSVHLYSKIVEILNQEGLIEMEKNDIAGIVKNMYDIREIAYAYSVLAAFYYEDVILMYRDMPIESRTRQEAEMVASQKKKLNYALEISKNELCYNFMTEKMKESIINLQAQIEGKKARIKGTNINEFRAGMRVDLKDLDIGLGEKMKEPSNNQEKNIQLKDSQDQEINQ